MAVLAEGYREAGRHRASIEGVDLPAGVYVLRLLGPDGPLTTRVTRR
jgi:hypothetical protein